MGETHTQFRDAAMDMLTTVAEHGDESGRAVPAAIAMLMAHDMAQSNAMIEGILRGMVARLEEENAELREELRYWRDVAEMGVTPGLYARLGLGSKGGAA